MSFSRRTGSDAACYSRPLDSLEGWNDHFFWVDAFAYPAIFPWHTSKSVSKDPFPKSTEFNTGHYASLVAYPALFHKYPESFICLVGLSRYYTLDENTYPEFLFKNEMNLLSFIRTADPSKVRIGERKRGDDEPQLLDTTVGRVVPLLPVSPARTNTELEASVDRLFDEGGSGTQLDQRDLAGGVGEQGADIQPVTETADIVAEDVILLPPRRHKKRKTIVVDAGEPSHPPKRLRRDCRTLSGASVGGKSMSTVRRLLAGAVQNAEVRGEPVPTLPFVTSSVSATLEREGEDHTDSVANLQTFVPPLRFVISLNSSHYPGANFTEAEVDSVVKSSAPVVITITTVTTTVDAATAVKEAPTRPFLFGVGLSLAGGIDPTPGGFSDVSGSDFLIGDIRTIVDPDFDLQKAYVPHWSVTNGSHLDEGRGMEHDQHFTKFNVGAARQVALSAEAEAAEAIHLRAEASKFEAIVKSLQDEVKVLRDHNTTLEKEKSESDNLAGLVHELVTSSAGLQGKLYVDFVEMALHLEEKFYPHLLTTITGRRWLLTYGMKLAIVKYLHSLEYLSAHGAAISKAIEKGMQYGLAFRITHGQEALRDVFIPLVEPLSSATLEGTEDTSGTAPKITTALSVTFATVSSIPPISTDDYNVVHADGQEGGGADANPFPNFDDAELNIE
ncbi:hypothetical protein Tco_1171000 [Tanacetum coccineum]